MGRKGVPMLNNRKSMLALLLGMSLAVTFPVGVDASDKGADTAQETMQDSENTTDSVQDTETQRARRVKCRSRRPELRKLRVRRRQIQRRKRHRSPKRYRPKRSSLSQMRQIRRIQKRKIRIWMKRQHSVKRRKKRQKTKGFFQECEGYHVGAEVR